MFGWWSRPAVPRSGSSEWPMLARLLEEDARSMDTRRAVIGAIHLLNETERAQLLLYLLGDDWAALDVIDSGKWRYQEHLGGRTDALYRPDIAPSTDRIPSVPEGEGLS